MALSDHRSKSKTKRRAVGDVHKHWSDKQKLEAVSLYLQLGNLALTAATLKIPEQTIRDWRGTEWWERVAAELKIQDNIQFSQAAKRLIDKGMGVMADRLENGEWIYDQKKGKMVRKPVGLRDATTAVNSMIDKKLLLDKQEVKVVDAERLEDKLNKLMDRFSQLATGQPPKQVEVTDVIYVSEDNEEEGDIDEGDFDNALHEGWQAGLQEGEQAVQQPTGANQGEVGTDSGSEEKQ